MKTQNLQLITVTLTGYDLETQETTQLEIPMYFDKNIPFEIRNNTAQEFGEEYALQFDCGVLIRVEEKEEVEISNVYFQGGGLWLDKRFDETLQSNTQLPC